jgi:hypothetical protein
MAWWPISQALRFATMRSPSRPIRLLKLRIIAACVIRAVASADHLTYLVDGIQNADDHVSLTFYGGHPTQSHDPARAWELEFFARFVDRAATRGDRNEAFDRRRGCGVRAVQPCLRAELQFRRFEWG